MTFFDYYTALRYKVKMFENNMLKIFILFSGSRMEATHPVKAVIDADAVTDDLKEYIHTCLAEHADQKGCPVGSNPRQPFLLLMKLIPLKFHTITLHQ